MPGRRESQNRTGQDGANENLAEMCRAAETANEAKSKFLANMSHELRTPLHGIISFATFGLRKMETATHEDLLRYFDRIEHSAETLLALVDDLLDLAKLESGRSCFEFRATDLGVLVRSVIEELSSIAARRQIAVEYIALGHDADVLPHPRRFLDYVEARYRSAALVGLRQPAEHAYRRGLASAVGAEQAEYLTLLYLEVDVVHCGERAETLRQFSGVNNRHLELEKD